MPSLTPIHKREEITWQAMREGLFTGGLTLVPAYGALHLALQRSPKFVKSTNWQSRTALVIMPALFMFAFTAESKLNHGMRKLAAETSHTHETVKWAEQQTATTSVMKQQQYYPKYQSLENSQNASDTSRPLSNTDGSIPTLTNNNNVSNNNINESTEVKLLQLYRQSVSTSGIRIVPGDTLGLHHVVANFWQEHPFKLLAFVGVPTVGYIFYGRSQKGHLSLSLKLLHTRVFGQFAVISLLLSFMGFKAYMDRYGTFITQAQADAKVEEMMRVRNELLAKLEWERRAQQERENILSRAHQQDILKQEQEEGGSNSDENNKKQEKKKRKKRKKTKKSSSTEKEKGSKQ